MLVWRVRRKGRSKASREGEGEMGRGKWAKAVGPTGPGERKRRCGPEREEDGLRPRKMRGKNQIDI